jgi:hypothetical protein
VGITLASAGERVLDNVRRRAGKQGGPYRKFEAGDLGYMELMAGLWFVRSSGAPCGSRMRGLIGRQ